MNSGIAGLLPDSEIRKLCVLTPDELSRGRKPMISPFAERTERGEHGGRIPSYGLSPAGYDLRQSFQLSVYEPGRSVVIDASTQIDVTDFDDRLLSPLELLRDERGRYFLLPARQFALGVALERIHMPPDVVATTWPKSTWIRAGLYIANTVIEPGWRGDLVLEYRNMTEWPIKLHLDVGIAQLRFERLATPPERPYDKLNGRYQNQAGLTTPR